MLGRLGAIVLLTMMLGVQFGTAEAQIPLPMQGVVVEEGDDWGNRLRGRGDFFRQPESPTSQNDLVFFSCEVTASAGVAAAVGIAASDKANPSLSDGCYLTLDGVPVDNAVTGVGVPGEAAAMSSDPSDPYVFDTVAGGELEVCVTGRGLFANGGFVEVHDCGSEQADPGPSRSVRGSGRYLFDPGSATSVTPGPSEPGFPVLIECEALSTPGAIETSVESCELRENGTSLMEAEPATSPGSFSIASNAAVLHVSSPTVCWVVTARFPDEEEVSSDDCS